MLVSEPFWRCHRLHNNIISLSCSRPKEMTDIAHQEEVVKTLVNSIETGNVGDIALYTGLSGTYFPVFNGYFHWNAAASLALLWTARNRENFDHLSYSESLIWVRFPRKVCYFLIKIRWELFFVKYSPEVWRSRVLELNASNERGIKVVRTKVKDFAMGSVSASSKRYGRVVA